MSEWWLIFLFQGLFRLHQSILEIYVYRQKKLQNNSRPDKDKLILDLDYYQYTVRWKDKDKNLKNNKSLHDYTKGNLLFLSCVLNLKNIELWWM